MASTTQKKTSGAKKPSASKAAASPEKRPIRREIWGLVCFLVGLFSFIGYFKSDALFIIYICAFIKALIGYGYYLFPPALFVCTYILFFHHGRPVQARTICMLLVPVAFGVLADLIVCRQDFSALGINELLPKLYETGKEMISGGLICGALSIGFEKMFSVFGAVPVFLLAFIALLMVALKITPKMVVEKIKKRERLEYVPEPEPERTEKTPMPPAGGKGKRHGRGIDIPTDDEPKEEYKEKLVGFFNASPRVKSPDQILAKHRAADESSEAQENEELNDAVEEPDYSTMDPIDVFPNAKPKPEFAAADKAARTENESVTASPAPASRVKAVPLKKPTAEIEPLSVEEAANLAGVTITGPEDMVKTEEYSTEQVRAMRSPAKKAIDAVELQSNTEEVAKAVEEKNASSAQVYNHPPVSLLRQGSGSVADGTQEVSINRERLQTTLNSFGVSATICDTTRGPTVTRYDVELDTGVKLSKLTNLAGDLALSLGVTGVRIAPIPDKISTVGVEVPNKIVSTVYLRDIIDTDVFRNASSKLTFALGKDIGGSAITGNIAKLPHLLIAGTTGSGKSVCMNSLILSLLYKASPEEVRLIMIDPKMVELGIYNGIPHLYIPVVTDPKKAAGALQWSVIEMLKRYRLFSERGVRDLAGYNALPREEGEQKLPQVVIVIDELADLMMTAAKEVEESICRVAQMGRAAGVHLVIATQRPSADVITGLMKANIPSRIAFAVSSAMESRIILDQVGAEKLVGSGDMLYAPLGIGKPTRIQGAFVSDEEREDIVNFIKQYGEAQYSEEILESIEQAAKDKSGSSSDVRAESVEEPVSNDYDELLPQAVEVIFETKQASVSMLQRRLKLGYSRAARIVDQMEEIGVVGPFEGSKPRQILITKEQWNEQHGAGNGQNSEDEHTQLNFSDIQDEFGDTEE